MSRILVVDDSALTRQCTTRLLARAGHTATAACNGREAWMTLYAGVPDLIVLDLMMPQLDGIAFLRLLRQHHFWNHLPVVIVTGHTDEDRLLDEARALGVSAVIQKGPDAIDELLDRVARLIRPAQKPRATPRRQSVLVA